MICLLSKQSITTIFRGIVLIVGLDLTWLMLYLLPQASYLTNVVVKANG